MKKFLIATVIGGLAIIPGMSGANAAPKLGLHCPDHNVAGNAKDESGSDDNDLVPASGTLICVKAGSGSSNDTGSGNTGIITANGTSTLRQYLAAAGIVDGGGVLGRNVSYWVTYPANPQITLYACFDGELEVFGPGSVATVEAALAAFLAANSGSVEADSDTDCSVDETTTTTVLEVTTTTVPVVTETPTETPRTGVPVTVVPEAAPVAGPAPAPAKLPHTGSNSTLALIGVALLLGGAAAFGLRRFATN